MKKVYRCDSQERPIVHGKEYWYRSQDPLLPYIKGVIKWDKDLLNHIFYPEDKAYSPIIVQYRMSRYDKRWLNAWEYKRAEY